MTEQELRDIFKPDAYGFCPRPGGKKENAVWFDTALLVQRVLDTHDSEE